MTDAVLIPAPAAGAPAPGMVGPAAPATAEGSIMPGFAQMLGGMEGGDKQASPVPGAARAIVALPNAQPAEVESPPLPSPIVPSQDSVLPVATVAAEVPKVPETQPDAATDAETDGEKAETPSSETDQPPVLLNPTPQSTIAVLTPPPAQLQPTVTTNPHEGRPSSDPEVPSPALQTGFKRQDAPIVAPSLSDMTGPQTPNQPGHMPPSPEQHDDATGATPSPTLALPDQPTTPSAPARAATQTLSTAPGRFGEELGIAIARHASRGNSGAAETLSLRLDPPEHGRIEVTLSFEDGGPLRAVVAASQPATLDLLRRDSADLSRALGQAGIGTDAQSFSFSAQSQNSGRERQGQAFPPHPTATNNWAMAAEEAPMPTPDYRRLHSGGSLNLIA